MGREKSGNDGELLEKLEALQADVDLIKNSLALSLPAREQIGGIEQQLQRIELLLGKGERKPSSFQLKVFFDKSSSERKPFLLKTDGAVAISQKLSTIRAAIILVLLLDLQDRYEGGKGVVDVVDGICRAYKLLAPEAGEETNLQNSVRVALYRFDAYCKGERDFANNDFRLWFNAQSQRFQLIDCRNQRPVERAVVEVTTHDHAVAAVIDRVLAQSPIARARKRRALYVPSGPEGADRFLLEMYDHNYPLKVNSLYVRPPLPSYPTSLLEYMGVSEKVIQRKRQAFEGYKSGRFSFVEILSEETIWDLIRYSPKTGFKLYPKDVKAEQVTDHIDNLIYILKTFDNYSLYLTGASIPFALVTYEIKSGPLPECFTVFFQAFASAAQRDLGCFVLYGTTVYQNITENIIDWIIAHPTTVRERSHVIKILQKVRTELTEKGPLPFN